VETSISGFRYISSVHPWNWILCIGVSCHLVAVRCTPTW